VKCYFDEKIKFFVHKFPVRIYGQNGEIDKICTCYCGSKVVDRTDVKIKFGTIFKV
jgi:hypothetical protein